MLYVPPDHRPTFAAELATFLREDPDRIALRAIHPLGDRFELGPDLFAVDAVEALDAQYRLLGFQITTSEETTIVNTAAVIGDGEIRIERLGEASWMVRVGGVDAAYLTDERGLIEVSPDFAGCIVLRASALEALPRLPCVTSLRGFCARGATALADVTTLAQAASLELVDLGATGAGPDVAVAVAGDRGRAVGTAGPAAAGETLRTDAAPPSPRSGTHGPHAPDRASRAEDAAPHGL